MGGITKKAVVTEAPPGSGWRAREAITPPPQSTSRSTSLPRLASDPEIDAITNLSEVVTELARLSDGSVVPELSRAITREDDLNPEEAFITSLLGMNVSLEMILDMSPLAEDETVRVLARLVTRGLVTVPAPRRSAAP